MAQSIGIVDITWKGLNLPVEVGSEFTPGGIANEAVPYGRGVMRSQKFEPSQISATILLAKGTRYDDIVTQGEDVLVVRADTGAIYTFPEAFIVGRPKVGSQGKVAIEWQAGAYEEVMA